MALSQLFRAYLSRNFKPYIAAVTLVDGVGILVRLQKVFVPTTHADFSRALQDLQDLQMTSGESISNFMRRFHTAHEAMTDVAQSPNSVSNTFTTALMFLDKLNTGVTSMDLRLLLTNFHLQMQQCSDVNNPPCTVESVELALSDLESRLTCQTCGARYHTTPSVQDTPSSEYAPQEQWN